MSPSTTRSTNHATPTIILPVSSQIQHLTFWKSLKPKDQSTLTEVGRQLPAEMTKHGNSGLAIGELLQTAYTILVTRKGAFEHFIKCFNFSRTTAYRFRSNYVAVTSMLPDPVIQGAMARGMDVVRVYPNAIRKLPPPRALANSTPGSPEVKRYLDQVVATKKQELSAKRKGIIAKSKDVKDLKKDPKLLLMQSFRLVRNSMRTLDGGHGNFQDRSIKRRKAFLDSLVGMLLSDLGIGNQATFKPEAIPEEFLRDRGRPRLEDSE